MGAWKESLEVKVLDVDLGLLRSFWLLPCSETLRLGHVCDLSVDPCRMVTFLTTKPAFPHL